MITLREYNPDVDYETISEWWHGHGHDPIPKIVLPKLGVLAVRNLQDKKPEDVAAAWCYMDNSVGVAMMEWIISKPDVSGVVLKSAFQSIVEYFMEDLRDSGYTVLMAHCASDKLASLFSLNGFSRVEKVNHMVMGI